jgi:SSS family solute:Na+ symporter
MTTISWVIFVSIFGVLLAFTIWSKRFVKDVSGFLVAGRKTRIWLGLSNQFSGGLGLVAIAYMAQQGFCNGLAYIWIALFQSLVVVIIFGILGFGIQRLRASRAMTAGQYHQMRYSRGLRLLVGLVCGIGGVLNMAIFPVTGAKFITYFLGWPLSFILAGIEFSTINVITAVLIIAAVFFAVICGQIGVIITDYLQSIIIVSGLMLVIFLIFKQTGVIVVRDALYQKMGEAAFNPLVTSKYGWQWLVWIFAAVWWGPFCFGPIIAKNASTSNSKVTRMTTLISGIFGNGKNMMMLSLGVGALLIMGNAVPENFNPAEYKLVASAMFLHSITGPILTGLLLAAFVSAFISTNDTYMLSWAGIWINDVLSPLLPKPMSTKTHLWSLRITIILIGIFLYFFGVMFKIEDSVLEFLMLTGTMYLGGGIAMVGGLYWKRACTAGAYAAVLTTMVLPVVHLVMQKCWPVYKANVPAKTAGLITIASSIILLVVLSLLNRKPTKYIDYGTQVKQDETLGFSQ